MTESSLILSKGRTNIAQILSTFPSLTTWIPQVHSGPTWTPSPPWWRSVSACRSWCPGWRVSWLWRPTGSWTGRGWTGRSRPRQRDTDRTWRTRRSWRWGQRGGAPSACCEVAWSPARSPPTAPDWAWRLWTVRLSAKLRLDISTHLDCLHGGDRPGQVPRLVRLELLQVVEC